MSVELVYKMNDIIERSSEMVGEKLANYLMYIKNVDVAFLVGQSSGTDSNTDRSKPSSLQASSHKKIHNTLLLKTHMQ